jgi:hypothetical protein
MEGAGAKGDVAPDDPARRVRHGDEGQDEEAVQPHRERATPEARRWWRRDDGRRWNRHVQPIADGEERLRKRVGHRAKDHSTGAGRSGGRV